MTSEPIPACAAGVPFLRALPPAALAELTAVLRHRHLERGELIALAGDPVEALIVVASGRLNALRTSRSGREQVVRSVGPGEFLGELALFTPASHEADLVAMEPTEVCLLGRQSVQQLLGRHPDVAPRLVEALARRLAEAERSIGELGLHDVGQRLAAELARLAEQAQPGPDGLRLRMPISWVELAARLGTTPESLSRRLRTLAEQGLISQEGGRTLLVRDLEALRSFAES